MEYAESWPLQVSSLMPNMCKLLLLLPANRTGELAFAYHAQIDLQAQEV